MKFSMTGQEKGDFLTGLVWKYQWWEFPVVITGKYRPGKYSKFQLKLKALNTGDYIIEVTAWEGLTVSIKLFGHQHLHHTSMSTFPEGGGITGLKFGLKVSIKFFASVDLLVALSSLKVI